MSEKKHLGQMSDLSDLGDLGDLGDLKNVMVAAYCRGEGEGIAFALAIPGEALKE